MREMRIPGHPRPYYISYLIREEEEWRIQAKYGALIADTHDRKRNAFVDVRVGSARSDQVRDGGLLRQRQGGRVLRLRRSALRRQPGRPAPRPVAADRRALPRGGGGTAAQAVPRADLPRSEPHLAAFEKREPLVDLGWQPLPEVDREHWAGWSSGSRAGSSGTEEIKDSHVEFQAEHTCRVFVNSEGSRRSQCQPIWSLECYLWLLSDGGRRVSLDREAHGHRSRGASRRGGVPAPRSARRWSKLRRLAQAPTIRSFCGPALLDPVPAGLLIHEAVGHRLEGNRLLAVGRGADLQGLASASGSCRRSSTAGRPAPGAVRGPLAGGPLPLRRRGRRGAGGRAGARRAGCEGFLTSRTGIARRHRSNGHARSHYHQRPISRMGVLRRRGRGRPGRRRAEAGAAGGDPAAEGALRRAHHRGGTSGETATDAYNFQAFLGEVSLAAKVYPDGREEWIRGVNFVGTPLNAIHGIIAAGRRREVDNAYCGAESGYVPVSTISPGAGRLRAGAAEPSPTPRTRSIHLPSLGAQRVGAAAGNDAGAALSGPPRAGVGRDTDSLLVVRAPLPARLPAGPVAAAADQRAGAVDSLAAARRDPAHGAGRRAAASWPASPAGWSASRWLQAVVRTFSRLADPGQQPAGSPTTCATSSSRQLQRLDASLLRHPPHGRHHVPRASTTSG